MKELVIIEKSEFNSSLRNELISILEDFENKKRASQESKVYTINRVAKQLGLAHATVSKYVKSGLIKSTKSGLITEEAINDFLNR